MFRDCESRYLVRQFFVDIPERGRYAHTLPNREGEALVLSDGDCAERGERADMGLSVVLKSWSAEPSSLCHEETGFTW